MVGIAGTASVGFRAHTGASGNGGSIMGVKVSQASERHQKHRTTEICNVVSPEAHELVLMVVQTQEESVCPGGGWLPEGHRKQGLAGAVVQD
mmetsp:Transcript_22293/g.66061  ORF Transcript_22293/g.66061 Transcript_22293/m.66061 type:complete len:92 (-) Transcript_22293:896-1171(-)